MTFDLIDYIIKIWQEEWNKSGRMFDYIPQEKDKKAVGLLLKKARTRHPKKDTEDMCDMLRSYFRDALMINDTWYKSNMSLTLLNSKINEINQLVTDIRTMRKRHKKQDELSENLKQLESNENVKAVFEAWRPYEEEKKPYISRVEWLRRYGSARLNEYEEYKKKMYKK